MAKLKEEGLFDHFIIVTSGNLQHCGSPDSGCVELTGLLASRYGCNNRVRVELCSYDDNMEHVAEMIYRWGPKVETGRRPQVMNAAFSWGGGKGMPALANALLARGIDLAQVVLADPVHYSFFARWRAVLAHNLLGQEITIKLPTNVGHVRWSRQCHSIPCGHRPVATGHFTVIDDPEILTIPHTQMDNSKTFFRQAVLAAEDLTQIKTRQRVP